MFLFNPITCERVNLQDDDKRISCNKVNKKIKGTNFYLFDDDTRAGDLRYFMELEVLDDETWEPVIGTDKEVSNYGRFRTVTIDGYRMCIAQNQIKQVVIYIRIDGKSKAFNRGRLVAETFLGKPEKEDMVVVCKDGDKWNSNPSNLMWMTRKDLGNLTGKGNRMPVAKIDPETGKRLKVYDCVKLAADDNFISRSSLYVALDKAGRKAAGYKWVRV